MSEELTTWLVTLSRADGCEVTLAVETFTQGMAQIEARRLQGAGWHVTNTERSGERVV